MNIEDPILLLEEILSDWRDIIGAEYQGYRNHVYRMIHFCWNLKNCNAEEKEKIIIAGAFHDIGIWIEDTVDYIPPSIPPTIEYLRKKQLQSWSEEIQLMITEHHKLKQYKGNFAPLVELFRQGDLVDFSFGMFNFGIEKTYIEAVKQHFPNSDFHKNLLKREMKWLFLQPFNPLPMMKW